MNNQWLKLTHPNTGLSSIAYMRGDIVETSEWRRPLKDFQDTGYKIVPVVVVESEPGTIYVMKSSAVMEVQAKLRLMGVELTLTQEEVEP